MDLRIPAPTGTATEIDQGDTSEQDNSQAADQHNQLHARRGFEPQPSDPYEIDDVAIDGTAGLFTVCDHDGLHLVSGLDVGARWAAVASVAAATTLVAVGGRGVEWDGAAG